MPNWRKLIVSGSDAALNSLNVINAVTASFFVGDGSGLTNLPSSNAFPFTGSAQITGSLQVIGPTNLSGSLTASGLVYPTIDGTVNQAIITDGAGNLSFGNPYASNTVVNGKNLSGGTIAKGTPLYFTGSGTSGNLVGVYPADAGNPNRMPAGGVAGEQILNGEEGTVFLNGFINGVNTSIFASGDEVFVAVGGGYTNITPTGSALIQHLGYVEKSAVNGSGVINMMGEARGLPNIQQGYVWIGDSNGVPQAVATSSIQNVVSASFATTASYALFAANGGGGSVDTGSLLTTGSVSGNVLTFTKGDSTTFNLTVNTGSGTTNTGSLLVTGSVSGNVLTFTKGDSTTFNLTVNTGSGTTNTGSLLTTGSVSGNVLTFTKGDSTTFTLTVVTGSGGGGGGGGAAVTHTQATASNTWSFNHNLNTLTPLLQVYDLNYEQIIPNEVVSVSAFTSEIRFDYTQAGYAVASSGGGLVVTGSTPRLTQTAPATTWSFAHNLGTQYPGFEVFDQNDYVIVPAGIYAVDENNAEIYFATPSAGVAIANFSGIGGVGFVATSASFAATSSYSDQFNIGQTQTRYATVASSINGSNTIFNQATGSYTSAFFKYTVGKTTNARSGEIMAVWNGSTVAFTDNSTTDIGSTTPVTASVVISGANIRLNVQTNTSGWKVKSIATFM